MSRRGRKPRPPRSYKAGRLLGLVEADLPGLRMETAAPGHATFTGESGQPVFDVVERVERRFLGSSEIARFIILSPADPAPPMRLEVRHTGKLKRSGVAVRPVTGGERAAAAATALAGDRAFRAAVFPLDFTFFEVEGGDQGWAATIELMGATYVSIALPPMRNYVHLYPDQRDALLSTVAAWRRSMSGQP
jgi:Protein of unknown function (DUF3156)